MHMGAIKRKLKRCSFFEGACVCANGEPVIGWILCHAWREKKRKMMQAFFEGDVYTKWDNMTDACTNQVHNGGGSVYHTWHK